MEVEMKRGDTKSGDPKISRVVMNCPTRSSVRHYSGACHAQLRRH